MGTLTLDERERLRGDAGLVPEPLREWWLNYLRSHTAHYESVLSRLPAPDACGPLLEIGAVPGHLTLLLKRRGYDVQSVDLDPARLAELWSHDGVRIHQVDIETQPLPFADTAFSCVLFTEILEHLRIQPVYALQEATRVLAHEGRLILSTPNITPLDRIGFLFGKDYQGDVVAEFDKLRQFGHMGHVRLYSIKEVHRLLEHVGYNKIQFRREGRLAGHMVRRILFPWRNAFASHAYFVASRRG